jgi:hypothetical protein
MGLRFRKSVTLCKGVKLNLGKTGMSVTLGPKGYHKTIHQNGNVTTSMGIPGTGIYWTDTKNIRGKSDGSRSRSTSSRTIPMQEMETEQIGKRIEPMFESGERIRHETQVAGNQSGGQSETYHMASDLDDYFKNN